MLTAVKASTHRQPALTNTPGQSHNPRMLTPAASAATASRPRQPAPPRAPQAPQDTFAASDPRNLSAPPLTALTPPHNVTLLLRDETGRPQARLLLSAHVLQQCADVFDGMFAVCGDAAQHEELEIPFPVRFNLWSRLLRDLHDGAPLQPAPHELLELYRLVRYMGPRDTRIGNRLADFSKFCLDQIRVLNAADTVQLFCEAVQYNLLADKFGQDLCWYLLYRNYTDAALDMPADCMRALLAYPRQLSQVHRLQLAKSWAEKYAAQNAVTLEAGLAHLQLADTLPTALSQTLAKRAGVPVTHAVTTVPSAPGTLRFRDAAPATTMPLSTHGDLVVSVSNHCAFLWHRVTGAFVQRSESGYFYGGWHAIVGTRVIGEGLGAIHAGDWVTGRKYELPVYGSRDNFKATHGDKIVLITRQGDLLVWDTQTASECLRLHRPPAVEAAALNDKQLAVAYDLRLRIHDAHTGSPINSFPLAGPLRSLAWTQTGMLAALSGQRTVLLYPPTGGEPIWRFCIDFMPTCSHLSATHAVFGSKAGEVVAVRYGTSKILRIAAHQGEVRSVFGGEGELVSNGADKTIAVWEL